MSTNYKYWAFISYSHADEDKAKYIEKIVTKYKLPKTLKECYIQMPNDLNPIFRDVSGLCAGPVDNSLDEKLKLSKNLIVVSTENSVKSSWVDYEIEKYKCFNSDCAIIPVIFSDKPIFNKLLEKENLVAIPFTKETEKKSICRLIASCLGSGIEPYQVKHRIDFGRIIRIACLVGCIIVGICYSFKKYENINSNNTNTYYRANKYTELPKPKKNINIASDPKEQQEESKEKLENKMQDYLKKEK
jgi:hypothetical protein